MMQKISDIIRHREMFFVEKHQTVCDVARKMAQLSVGAILVFGDGQLEGIFSERDLMTRVIVAGLDADRTRVGDVMSTHLATVNEEALIEEAMELMQKNKCRHLPVLRGSRAVGLVSMRDIMDIELERKTEEIQQMRAYIHGQ
jgi:signal-transduction protein with cAMP-binding, CBS, and nucleotidyltransferase domain